MDHSALRGKRMLVTGATGGIGREIARRFASVVGSLVLTGRNAQRLAETGAALAGSDLPARVITHAADLGSDTDMSSLLDCVRREFGGIDVLVNCAGVFPVHALGEASVAEFDACFNVNVRAPFALCLALVPDMAARGWGRVVNIGSSSAYAGFKDTSVYCASKHALLGLSRSLHDEYKRQNVRVFCVSPGSVKTEMGRLVRNQTFETFLDPAEIAEFLLDLISHDGPMIAEEVRLNRILIQ